MTNPPEKSWQGSDPPLSCNTSILKAPDTEVAPSLTHMVEDEIFVLWPLVRSHRIIAWSKHCDKAEKTEGMLKVAKNDTIEHLLEKVDVIILVIRV